VPAIGQALLANFLLWLIGKARDHARALASVQMRSGVAGAKA
jgi:hypothetical protein